MHIGIDARLPAYRRGGISQYTLALLPALAALDSENQYTIYHSRRDQGSHLPAGATNFRRRTLWTPCHHRWERWTLGGEIVADRLDVLHSPDFIPPAWGAVRRVITVHDLNFLYYPQFLTAESRRYYRDQIAWAVQTAAHIIADSEHTRQDLLDRLDVTAAQVTTIHLAAGAPYTAPVSAARVAAALARYELPRDFILFVGTIEPRKNLALLLDAYQQLRDTTAVDVPLVLVGGHGWLYEHFLKKLATLPARAAVHHLTAVPDEDLAALYTAAGVHVLPSHYEGFGLTLLEAMHCGCPVICSDRGSLPEVVGEAGLIVAADDVAAWVAALESIYEDLALRSALVAKGRAQAARFRWETTARRTLAVYQAAAARA